MLESAHVSADAVTRIHNEEGNAFRGMCKSQRLCGLSHARRCLLLGAVCEKTWEREHLRTCDSDRSSVPHWDLGASVGCTVAAIFTIPSPITIVRLLVPGGRTSPTARLARHLTPHTMRKRKIVNHCNAHLLRSGAKCSHAREYLSLSRVLYVCVFLFVALVGAHGIRVRSNYPPKSCH